MNKSAAFAYGGVSNAEIAVELFDLGKGVEFRHTFAHLFSANMMAFSPPGPEGYHPAPWKAAKGGFGFDIEVEIKCPHEVIIGEKFTAREIIWLVAALLRISQVPFLSVPVISDQPFSAIAQASEEPTLEPFEIETRIFGPAASSNRVLDVSLLEWVKKTWVSTAQLINSNPKFHTALKALDSATVRGRTSSSLLAIWGGIEQLFAPSQGELRFRVAALLASYLEPPGDDRLALYKTTLKLYNNRSTAAHTAQEIDSGPLVESYVLLRNAIMKMITENHVPSQTDLEASLFGSENESH